MKLSGNAVTGVPIFLLALAGQITAAITLPLTDSFRNPGWTAASLASYFASIWLIAVLIKRGLGLSIIIPLISGVAPLSIALIAIFFGGEPGSVAKISALAVACVMIGAAGLLDRK